MNEPGTPASATDAPLIAHVVAGDAGWLERQLLSELLRPGAVPFRQVLLSYTTRSSPKLSTDAIRRVHAPSRLPVFRTLALRRQLAQIVLETGARRIILHAWSAGAARWCTPLINDDQRLAIAVPDAARAADVVIWPTSGRLRHLATYICAESRAVQKIVSAGVPASKCAIIAPSLSWSVPTHERVESLHSELGLAPDDRVVAILPPLTRANCSFEAAWACILVRQVCPHLRVLFTRGTPESARIERLLRSVRHDAMACVAPADTPLGELAALADVAAYIPRASRVAPAWKAASAFGLPIVTTLPDSSATSQSFICRPGSVRDAARSILRALDHLDAHPRFMPPAIDASAHSIASAYTAVYARIADEWRGDRIASAAVRIASQAGTLSTSSVALRP